MGAGVGDGLGLGLGLAVAVALGSDDDVAVHTTAITRTPPTTAANAAVAMARPGLERICLALLMLILERALGLAG